MSPRQRAPVLPLHADMVEGAVHSSDRFGRPVYVGRCGAARMSCHGYGISVGESAAGVVYRPAVQTAIRADATLDAAAAKRRCSDSANARRGPFVYVL